MILEHESIDVFLGLDVGKTGHHAVALNRAGKKLYDKALPQDETKMRDILTKLAGHGNVLVIMDQPASIGALPVAVARSAGAAVGYLPGLAMRRIADLHPGQAKTDARDAAIIAEAARSMPHTLRSVELDDETLAELGVLCGFDDDLTGQITATSNRIRGLRTQIHPALERALGPHLDHPAVADLLARYPTPQALQTAGRGHVRARLKKHAPRAAERLTEAIFTALYEQTVVVVGTSAAGIVLPKRAEQLLALRRQREAITAQVEALAEALPLLRGPDVDARHRSQDLRTNPHRSQPASTSLPSRTWLPTPGSHRSRVAPGPRSGVSLPVGGAIRNSNEPCSSPPSPRCIIRPRGRITTGNVPRGNGIAKRSLPWPGVVPMSSSRCYATARCSKTPHPRTCPQRLDENHSPPNDAFAGRASGSRASQLRDPRSAGRRRRAHLRSPRKPMPALDLLLVELTLTGRITTASNATFPGSVGDPAVVYKPLAGEKPLSDFHHDCLSHREGAAYLVSEDQGRNVVPRTWIRDGPAGEGMIQLSLTDPEKNAVALVAVEDVPKSGW